MAIERLTALGISRLSKPGMYADGGNLWLQVSPAGTRSWSIRFTINGKARQMGIGSVLDVSLSEARNMAREARRLLNAGEDPIEARKARLEAQLVADAKTLTFKDAAERYLASHKAGWKSEKHAAQWQATLSKFAYPVFGDLSVAAIDTGLVLKAIEPIWKSKAETASRVRGRVESILSWATARGYRSGPNPAAWRSHLDRLLPAKTKVVKVKHFAAMPFDDLPGFMAELRSKDFVSARALEFTILCASRTGETIGARWSEIDLDQALWTLPGERMKAAKPHRVALSERAIKILKGLPREGQGDGYIFMGSRQDRPLSNMALLEALRGMRPDAGLTVHGFRSSFRDWVAECTSFPSEVVEMALAHRVSDAVEAAYRRGDLLVKRRRLAEAWSGFCGAELASAGKGGRVVAIGKRA
ncbi:tyrosine-type recombinase/integrase [Bosea sp. LjRoot237]|uniref:tyrosine-type recombinase/integrase n=1 Tax=Bosea sp. LjRoot237 TaxID=3342292 RepID=UPI003ECFEA81